MVRFCESPCGPQSMPWSLASVASEMEALLSAVTADAGASKMYGLDCGSGHVPSVTAVSRFTMRSWAPEKSWGIVVPSAVDGSLARFSPTTPAKCTSPPKPSVTVLPLPFQSGLSGERFGKCSAATVAWCPGAVDVVEVLDVPGLPPPPEKKAK